jgi:hypothetical protein
VEVTVLCLIGGKRKMTCWWQFIYLDRYVNSDLNCEILGLSKPVDVNSYLGNENMETFMSVNKLKLLPYPRELC